VSERWQVGVLGASLCTMRTGGPIAWVSKPTTREELEADIKMAGEQGIAYRVIGGGSDILLPDEGFDGLVIIPTNRRLEMLSETNFPEPPLAMENQRYRQELGKGFLEMEKKIMAGHEQAWIISGAGVPWGQLVMWSFTQGLLGLQWFARIPCAVGGAIYNNIHGEKQFLSAVVQQVTSFSPTKGWVTRLPSELGFDYDRSVFHEHVDEVIWEVVFQLEKGLDNYVSEAKTQYLDWTKAKTEKQPSGANAGSVFQNLSPEDPVVNETGMLAAGWYVDHSGCLGWQKGGMCVYLTHGNFIVNNGTGTQQDFIHLVKKIRAQVYKMYKVWLKPEVLCIMADGNTYQWQKN
jgi:UDP-N-acetylmuramate dehydrogenase